ncbi:N-acetylglucosaminyl-diphospho-decaprenol L-rhamnosyltransferase [Corynebacterium guangdongense]|nr:N-acetylglucosaminyl-diphospho-decaprenol L-rhamnosyltransferase [Corynebacterium guangdongense]
MYDIVNAQNPPLAIVTVTYSPGEHLAHFLDSIGAATVGDTRVVLADNGSTDGVPQAAAAARDGVEFLDTGGNVGYGSGMNAAVRHLAPARARGEIDPEHFLITNPDVVFLPGSIDALLRRARQLPGAAAVGPRILEPDGSTYPSARAVPTLANGIGHALFGAVWPSNPWTAHYRHGAAMDVEHTAGWLSGSCLLVRWDAFEAVGGFDERYFMYMEDVDLGDRFTRAGYDNVYCPEAVITHAQGHSTESHPGTMLPAHHDSAYRFQADRLTRPWQIPVRWALWWGLKLRALVAVAAARARSGD